MYNECICFTSMQVHAHGTNKATSYIVLWLLFLILHMPLKEKNVETMGTNRIIQYFKTSHYNRVKSVLASGPYAFPQSVPMMLCMLGIWGAGDSIDK